MTNGLTLPNDGNEEKSPSTIQINISLAKSESASGSFSDGAWVRQVFTDLQNAIMVRVSFVPDDPEHIQSENTQAATPGEKASFEKFFEGQVANFDIDAGTTFVRLAEDGSTGTAVWVPKDSSQGLVVSRFTDMPPEIQPGVSLKNFRKCMKAQKAKKQTFAQAFCDCVNQL